MQPSTSSDSAYSSSDLQVFFIFGVWLLLMSAMFLFWPRNKNKRIKSTLNDVIYLKEAFNFFIHHN
jgi:hypothetical protein